MNTQTSKTILVVDDVKEQREIASEILEKLGYTVKAVASGEEAVNYIQDKPADLRRIPQEHRHHSD